MKKQTALCIAASAALLVLILDGNTAIAGIREGIQICIQTLIPSLFPFFICSGLLTGNLPHHSPKWMMPLAKFCRIPIGCESLMILGFLGGYPVGAQNIAQRWRQGYISQDHAQRMLAFCNNAGPAFLFGIIGSVFSTKWMPWALWGIHIVSAMLVGFILPKVKEYSNVKAANSKLAFADVLERSMRSMALVCGWVIFMRMVLLFLERWFLWIFPVSLQVMFSGILELSNGCIQLRCIPDEKIRFLLASGMLAFGGICVSLQTRSVTSGLSLKLYFPGKILQTAISLILASMVQGIFLPVVCIPSVIAILCFPAVLNSGKRKNAVAFQRKLLYNHLIQQ